MAHPNRKEASEGHNAKLRRMTEHYGAANPSMNKSAPTNRLKSEGPEDAVGFGADSSAAKARGDRPARTTKAANPVATYAKGGRVKGRRRADGGDVSAIEQANRNQTLATPNRARGGRMKGKGTHVNVIIAPQGAGAGAMPPPVLGANPAMAGAMPPPRPMMASPPPPGAAIPAGPMPMAPGAPGGIPPGMIPPRARGGKVAHPDEAQDKALIHRVLKDEGLVRSDKPAKVRARGGRLPNQKHHMTAGAVTGEGRLEKIGKKPKDAGKPQPV